MKTEQIYRTLIADDEYLARERLKRLLAPHSNKIEIIGEAENGIQCKNLIESITPDLVFLDIQMPGLNGFEILQQCTHMPLVIFCTAHDEYALQAFETFSIDYIVKPIKAERISNAIEKLAFMEEQTHRQELDKLIKELINQTPAKEITTIPVKIGERMLILPIEEVSYFQADEKYVSICTVGGKKYISDYSIKELHEKLKGKFTQIKRGILLNSRLVKEICTHSNSRYVIHLNDKNHSQLVSGRNYLEEVKKLMKL